MKIPKWAVLTLLQLSILVSASSANAQTITKQPTSSLSIIHQPLRASGGSWMDQVNEFSVERKQY